MKKGERAKLHAGFVVILSAALLCMPAISESPAQEVTDQGIASHLTKEFWNDASIPANWIEVKVENGIVSLSGLADNIIAKERSGKIAEAMVGVRGVINRIRVLPPMSLTDEEVKQSVQSALLRNALIEIHEIQAEVSDGVVTLNGTVDSRLEKQLCGTMAKGVKGVVELKNAIRVKPGKKRPDEEIEKELRQRLANEVRVDDAQIRVRIEDGNAILSGSVGSLQEKNLAVNLAYIAGVRSVSAEGLEIQWWARDAMRRKNLYAPRSEEEIKDAVMAAFTLDPRVPESRINISVNRNTVVLSGVVRGFPARRSALQDARNIAGVAAVVNNIAVRPDQPPANMELKHSVEKALSDDPYIGRFDLKVSTYGGKVYLFGTVSTPWEYRRAEHLVENVKGVVSVSNNLDYRREWKWKPDWEIERDIEEELYWSPFVDEARVKVSVENGIATLNGYVNALGEHQAAEEGAYEGGAKEVINKLKLTNMQFGPFFPSGSYGKYPPDSAL
jgi:osmotically-inducible protein OsmY